MIVLVETNFLLELVLQQEQFGACQELLAICSAYDDVQLVIPAFAVAEAGTTLERRQGERLKFIKEGVSRQISEIRRSQVLSRYRIILDGLRNELLVADRDENARWVDLQLSLREHVAPLNANILIDAISTRIGLNLEVPDALVLTSVRHYLEQARRSSDVPAIFVSTDRAGFGTPHVAIYLRDVGCAYINSFENAVLHLRHRSS